MIVFHICGHIPSHFAILTARCASRAEQWYISSGFHELRPRALKEIMLHAKRSLHPSLVSLLVQPKGRLDFHNPSFETLSPLKLFSSVHIVSSKQSNPHSCPSQLETHSRHTSKIH